MKDSKYIFFLLFLIVIFSTYAPTKNKKQNLFSINKILIQGENRINFSELSNKLSLIKGKNLLYISNADIAKLLDNFKQTIHPSQIDIKKDINKIGEFKFISYFYRLTFYGWLTT